MAKTVGLRVRAVRPLIGAIRPLIRAVWPLIRTLATN